MSERDLLKKYLASHRAPTKAEKRREANQETEWKGRMKDKEDAWDYKRDIVFDHYIRTHSYTERQCCCCKKITSYPVRCFTCKQDLCSRCDLITHCKLVLHNREICLNGEDKRFLHQNEFLSDDEETIKVKDCKKTNTSTTKPGSRDVVVITANGKSGQL
ncbi:uncharacterized protein LOC116927523 [Daphnia magna]|uniref:uncharacterized protein LOC116927523 n=1 Tax=Daphnia magna TaxID=35525 RepID=UPI001E1BB563|nr:uncharacterized protein LOC116927523 [Daphnia magna]